eukprot:CAMPEP_0171872234 /NCGR_PEP_ID=MMETSP0992-20121227/33680_1 /TAXON_ID=483369 /ORGANISM="non described non described, Strain CCMP2098" /LENGTH=56 /DNA_ID=CAMNT_0012496655 /DNA_START=21 /DNA_END=187 /DNA_ORIENTATION=+
MVFRLKGTSDVHPGSTPNSSRTEELIDAMVNSVCMSWAWSWYSLASPSAQPPNTPP